MGVRDLFFAIKARDETGAAFDRVKGNLRQVDGMAATVGDRFTRMGGGLMRFGAGATAATAGIFLAFRDSLSLFDFQERAQAKVAQAVKATGGAAGFAADALFDQARALQEVTRFGDEEILNGVTAQLLTFTNIAGNQFAHAQEAALNLSTVLDGDLQSASIMLGKALNDPVKGLSAMSRAGITFSQDQADVIKALAETGEMAAAQTLILEELEKQYGGQARAAAEAGLGAMDQLSNAWGDLKETVGGVIAEILPPMVDFFQSLISGFQAMPEPIQKTVVVIGLVAGVAGPAALALGALSLALGAITGPVALAVAGIAALVGVTAALWPETDNATAATDTLTLALGDEITQSQLLSEALGINGTMSVDVARKKLSEAQARHENVKAIIAEQRALALNSGAYQTLTSQIEDSNAALNSMGFPAIDVAVPMRAEAFEAEQQRLADLLVERQRLLDADGDMAEQLARTEENIRTLEESLAGASDGAITLGDGLVTPIVPAARLGDSLDRVAGSARNVNVETAGLSSGLEGVAETVEETKAVFDGFGRETSSLLKDLFADGKVTFQDFGDFVLAWGDRFLDRVLSQVFDPLGDAFQTMFDNMGSGGGGGGGLFGSLFSGIGNFFGGLFGGGGDAPAINMDTGGILGVSGRNGIDRNVARFGVSNDEQIHVVKRGQAGTAQVVNVKIMAQDPAAFKASKGQIARDLGRAVSHGQRFA
jgi:hypothetical protein